jgi:hypothetical protein
MLGIMHIKQIYNCRTHILFYSNHGEWEERDICYACGKWIRYRKLYFQNLRRRQNLQDPNVDHMIQCNIEHNLSIFWRKGRDRHLFIGVMNFGIQKAKTLWSNWARSNLLRTFLNYWVLQYYLDLYQPGSLTEFPVVAFKV